MGFRLTTQSQDQDIIKTNYNNLAGKSLLLAKLSMNLEFNPKNCSYFIKMCL